MRLSKIQIAHHRNGIDGAPFYVCTFTYDRAPMVAVVFDEPGHVAVLERAMTMAGLIGFAQGNSWRGDVFEPALRDAIALWETARAQAQDAS